MIANELMIGDWVFTRGRIEQVTSIYDGYICTEHYEDSHDYYFEPIPLTPEILEKNGFVKEYVFSNLHHLTLNDEDNGVNIGYYPKDTHRSYSYLCLDKEYMSITEMPILYVHELQHVLRLCGIDKEIVI